MDFDEIRRLIITALFSDDILSNLLVLKGGNAISLVYGYGSRSSLDLDFSIESDFPDLDDARVRIVNAISSRFASAGFVLFDENFAPKPALSKTARWGGYVLSFKIIEHRKHQAMHGDPGALRRNATTIGPGHARTFRLEISKFENCSDKTGVELDDRTVYVYSPAMLVIEKLRAICQQMPEYPKRRHAAARARDFYDIHALISNAGVSFSNPQNLALVAPIFGAKEVPLALLDKIESQREFHRPDWPAVVASVSGPIEEYDFYFDFVVRQTTLLKSLWEK